VKAFVVGRLLFGLLALTVLTVIVFVLVRLAGDPVSLLLPPGAPVTEEFLQRFRQSLGLDASITVQFLRFAQAAVVGDFGTSIRRGRPAIEMVLERIPASAELALVALTLAFVVGLTLGSLTAFYRGHLLDRVGTTLALFGQSFPNFWLGLMLILLFGVVLQWFPPSGRLTWNSVVLPALTLGAYPVAQITLQVRAGLIEALNQDYVRVARSKGLSETSVLTRHALRNVAIPVITLLGLQARYLLAGSIIVETVFAWPGLGLLTIQAVDSRDFPVLQAVVFLLGVIIILTNLAVDVLYAYVDPRIRLA
jgi:peptide/nickel transport system permease protein